MFRTVYTLCFIAAIGLVSAPLFSDDEKSERSKVVEKLQGTWSNEALAKGKDDETNALIAFSSPKFDKDGGVQLFMAIKIWDKTKDGGGGRTVMLLQDEGKDAKDKWLLAVGSADEKFKGLPAVFTCTPKDDKLILVVKDGEWKGEHVLKKKW